MEIIRMREEHFKIDGKTDMQNLKNVNPNVNFFTINYKEKIAKTEYPL